MKNQIATTIEQSQRLIACGVNPDTADMMFTPHNTLSTERYNPLLEDRNYIPAWSLPALLCSVIPKHLDDFPITKWRPPFLDDEIWEMETPSVLNGDVKLYFSDPKWIVDYDWDGFSGTLPQSENPIEAVVLAIEMLHVNGYNLNKP